MRVGNAPALGRTAIVLQARGARSVQAVLVEPTLPQDKKLLDRDAVARAGLVQTDQAGAACWFALTSKTDPPCRLFDNFIMGIRVVGLTPHFPNEPLI